METLTEIKPSMTVEEFLTLNKSTESYSIYWRFDKEDTPEDAWMEKAREKAERDIKIFEERFREFESMGTERPKVGEFLIGYDGKPTRFTHAWSDGIQTGGSAGSGGFYLSGRSLSYSGGLDDSVPYELMELTEEKSKGCVWVFHAGSAGAHRGVYYIYPFNTWKLKTIDRIDWIKKVPYPFKVVEVNERVYDYALEVVPPVAQSKGFFAMGEADTHRVEQNRPVPIYYCFTTIEGRFFCVIDSIEDAKKKFAEFASKLIGA